MVSQSLPPDFEDVKPSLPPPYSPPRLYEPASATFIRPHSPLVLRQEYTSNQSFNNSANLIPPATAASILAGGRGFGSENGRAYTPPSEISTDARSCTDDGTTEEQISLEELVEEKKPIVEFMKEEADYINPAGEYDLGQDHASRLMGEYVFKEPVPCYTTMMGIPSHYSFLAYPNGLLDWVDDTGKETEVKGEDVETKFLWGGESF